MFNTELTVVNACLKTLGELRVNDLDEDHSMVPEARASFALCSVKEQKRKWWFNTEVVRLTRNSDGHIFVPADAISVDPLDKCDIVHRGRRLYYTGSSCREAGYELPYESVICLVVRHVPYEDLPVGMQELILYSSQLDFMAGYDADSNRFAQIQQAYRDSYIQVNAEHIRSIDVNMLRTWPIAGRLLGIGGTGTRRLPTFGHKGY